MTTVQVYDPLGGSYERRTLYILEFITNQSAAPVLTEAIFVRIPGIVLTGGFMGGRDFDATKYEIGKILKLMALL